MNKMLFTVLILSVLLFGCERGLLVSDSERGLLPPEPVGPVEGKSLPAGVGRAGTALSAAGWARGAWAVDDRGAGRGKIVFGSGVLGDVFDKTVANLGGSVGPFDLVWSRIFYTDVNYILGALRGLSVPVIDGEGVFVGDVDAAEGGLVTDSVWKFVDLVDPNAGALSGPHWIDLRGRSDKTLAFSIPGANFELNSRDYNSVVFFGCDARSASGLRAVFSCNDAGGRDIVVEAERDASGGVVRDASGKVRARLASDSGVGAWLLRDFDVAVRAPPVASVPPVVPVVTATSGAEVLGVVGLSPVSNNVFDLTGGVDLGVSFTVPVGKSGLVWSELKFMRTVDAVPAWQSVVLKKNNVAATAGSWIPVSAGDVLSASVPKGGLDVVDLNGVGVFACERVGVRNGFVKYDCGGESVKVNGAGSLVGTNVGKWVLKRFSVVGAELLPVVPCSSLMPCPSGQNCVSGACVSATQTPTPTPTPSSTPTPTPTPALEELVVTFYDGRTFSDPILGQKTCSLTGTSVVCTITSLLSGSALILDSAKIYLLHGKARNVNTGATSTLWGVNPLQLQQIDGSLVTNYACALTSGECSWFLQPPSTQMYHLAATATSTVPSATPTPTASPTPSPTATPTSAFAPTPTPTPISTPTPSPTPTPTSTPTPTPTPCVPATEICGNNVDEDCDGHNDVCPTSMFATIIITEIFGPGMSSSNPVFVNPSCPNAATGYSCVFNLLVDQWHNYDIRFDVTPVDAINTIRATSSTRTFIQSCTRGSACELRIPGSSPGTYVVTGQG